MNTRVLLTLAVLALSLPTAARAQTILYSDNLDSASGSAYNVIFSNTTAGYGAATFGFDYSTLGIPSAPNSVGGTTLGLKLEANKLTASPAIGGVSVSPVTSPIPAGLTNYAVRFDLWMNANGPFPAGGTGSTQHSGVSIGTTGTTHQYPGTATAPGNVDGVTFLASGEGGASGTSTVVRDYNAWVNPGAFLNNTGYAATGTNPQDNANPYYANFGGVAPPAAQAQLSANQAGTTAVGSQGFEWHTWTVTREGNTVRWFIRDRSNTDVLISTVDITSEPLAGTNFTLGHYDFFASVAPDADQQFLFGLFDNVVVFTPVPEPTTVLGLAAVGLAGVGCLRRRFARR